MLLKAKINKKFLPSFEMLRDCGRELFILLLFACMMIDDSL